MPSAFIRKTASSFFADCALATAIGAGKKSERLIRVLAPKFSAAQVRQALKRLEDRRFIVKTATPASAAAAYWASIGLVPEIAAGRLKKLRVQI